MSKAVIAAGCVSDEALMFLRDHGAVIDSTLGLTVIELPESAEICEPGYQSPQSEYGIQWTDEDGNDPDEWISVYLNLDANKTTVELKKSRSYEPSEEDLEHMAPGWPPTAKEQERITLLMSEPDVF